MALFPFFRNIEGAQGIVVGGGRHALEKVERLLPFGPELLVFSSEICPQLQQYAKGEMSETTGNESIKAEIKLVYREMTKADLDTLPAFVIVAGEDQEENRKIADWCRARRIPVNVVDDQEYCDFIFPSLITRGNLSVGICTNGASPSTGVLLKRKVEELIPDRMEEILDFLQEKRPEIQAKIPDKKRRFAFYYELSEACMVKGRPLTEAEFESVCKEYL